MSRLNRILSADWKTGVIVAEAGLTLAELIRIALPHGWFLPVTPGTKFVTLGGAVANDVHGKNHHVMGTFGCHVKSLTLHRSTEGVITVSPIERPEVFAATVGGLGLTGIIVAVELQLRPVASSYIEQRSIRFGGLDEFFDLAHIHDQSHEYSVAWIDCLAAGKNAGRGHYFVGTHAPEGGLKLAQPGGLRIPMDMPAALVNSFSLRAFNSIYYHRQLQQEVRKRVDYDAFFYPLDRLLEWNRMYGRAGFQQYQCVVPHAQGREIIRSIIREISRSGVGSFLAVLKQCGAMTSPGLLSFPLHGVSLALDFPQREEINRRLFEKMDALVHEAGGRLYPAKDAHMSAAHFQRAYPAWEQVEALRDPQLMSRFWKRVAQ
jgi:FAD/FMN-containing dehydrogenase